MQSIQEYNNTILSIIGTLPEDIRRLIDEDLNAETIAIRLNLAIDQERIDEMKDEVRRAVSGNIESELRNLNMRDLMLAHDIALNIHADDSVEWDYLAAQMIMVRRQFEAAAISAEDFTNAISEVSSGMRSIRSAQVEMQTQGGLSAGTISSLINELTEMGENHLDFLYREGNQVRLNTEAYRNLVIEGHNARITAIREERNDLQELLRLQEATRVPPLPEGLPQSTRHASASAEHQRLMEPWHKQLTENDAQIARTREEIERFNHQLELQEAILQTVLREQFNYIDTIGRMNTSLNASQTAMREMNDSGHISFETFSRLAETMPNIADYIVTINGRLVLNTQAWNQNEVAAELALQALREYAATLPSWNERTQGQIQLLMYLHEQYERLRIGVLTATEIMEQAIETTED